MRGSFSILHFFIFFFMLVFLYVLIQIGILGIVLEKLGLSADAAVLIFSCTLFGSLINLPLFSVQSPVEIRHKQSNIPPWFMGRALPFHGKTLIAINVGGALVPVCFSIYLIMIWGIPLSTLLLAIIIISAVSYFFSRPIPGLGIGMPILIAPLTAALTAISLAPEQAAPLAYISGTLGVLIGADLLRLKDVAHLAAPIASIGGAGTFDGIFFSGIIAVLLT